MSVSSLLGVVTGDLGPRFNLVGVIPSMVLIIFLFGLFFLWSEKPSVVPDIQVMVTKVQNLDLQQGVLIGLAVIFFSLIMQPLQLSLVKLLEGYWGDSTIAEFLSKIGKDIQRGRLKELEKDKNPPEKEMTNEERSYYWRRLNDAIWRSPQYYPRQERLLPMSLGNILRASEDRAGNRYGLIAVVIWPRLYPLLSDNLRNILDTQRNQLDMAVRFCVIFLISTVSSLILYFTIIYSASFTDFPLSLILSNSSLVNVPFMNIYLWMGLSIKYGLWLTIPISTLALSWLSYRGAISTALSYGRSIEAAFDLHRFDLLKALHLDLPSDLSTERKSNRELSWFLVDYLTIGKKTNFQYLHEGENKDNKKTGSPLQ
jgi:hypothetical protein